MSVVQELESWLKLFGVKISVDDLKGDKLPSFSNGVLLMDILEILDKKSQGNWESKPRNRAFSLKNVRRLFEILKKNRNMNMRHLVNEDDIVDGDGYVIRGLLEDLKQA